MTTSTAPKRSHADSESGESRTSSRSSSRADAVVIVQDCRRSDAPHGFKFEAIDSLRKALRRVMNSHLDVHFVSFVDAMLPPGQKPKKKELEEAKREFGAKLRHINPSFIVPLGASVTKLLTGKQKFEPWAGRRLEVGGFTVIPAYHPDFAYKSKKSQREYETHLRNAVSQILGGDKEKKPTSYKMYMDEDMIVDTLNSYAKSETPVAYDWETTDLDPHKGVPISIGLSNEEGTAHVLYWYERFGGPGITPRIKRAVAGFLSSDVPKVAHHAKFEIKWGCVHFGVEPNNLIGDTKQMHHLLDEAASAGLDDLAYQHTDMGGYDTPMQEFLDKGNKHHDAPPEFMRPYAGGDADCTLRVYNVLRPKIDEDAGLRGLWRNIVLPSIFTLARLELRGMCIDFKRVAEVETELKHRVIEIKEKLSHMPEVMKTLEHFRMSVKNGAKRYPEINLRSPDQVRYLLYTACKLKTSKESKKSKLPSTDSEVLEGLQGEHPVVDCILELRSAEYELSVLEVFREKKRADSTIYSDLVQDYVLTGRLASRDPNLQNIPTGSLVKECFVSRFKGGLITQADWDQLEIRLIGGEANDAFFINAYAEGRDIHMETAKGLTGKEEKDVLDEERTEAKRVNFGVIYGITEHGLSGKIKKTKEQAKAILDAWWDLHPDIRRWAAKNVREAAEKGYVRNRLGRKRHIDGLDSDKWWIAEAARRLATNSKIQSLGADVTMYIMTLIDNYLMNLKLKSILIGQVHDSIIIDTHPDEKPHVCRVIDHMVRSVNEKLSFLRIPLTMSVETGPNWNSLEEAA